MAETQKQLARLECNQSNPLNGRTWRVGAAPPQQNSQTAFQENAEIAEYFSEGDFLCALGGLLLNGLDWFGFAADIGRPIVRPETSYIMERTARFRSCRFARLSRGRCALLMLVAAVSFAFGQYRRGGFRISESARTAREIGTRSVDTPMWENPAGFGQDVFTFTRLRYGSDGWRGGVGGGSWSTDLPDADLNLSFRLQQMTSLKVDPRGRLIRAHEPDLVNYPFLMAAAPGAMELGENEIVGLRKFLLNGGFFLLTDFWGDREWNHFAGVMKQVLPTHSFVELTLDHPIYHCLFPIRKKNQVPRIDIGVANLSSGSPTWERGPDGEEVHHRAIFDDKGRLMVLALHNSDDSDGWEREGESTAYFHAFAEGMAYPLAINIIFYVMTH